MFMVTNQHAHTRKAPSDIANVPGAQVYRCESNRLRHLQQAKPITCSDKHNSAEASLEDNIIHILPLLWLTGSFDILRSHIPNYLHHLYRITDLFPCMCFAGMKVKACSVSHFSSGSVGTHQIHFLLLRLLSTEEKKRGRVTREGLEDFYSRCHLIPHMNKLSLCSRCLRSCEPSLSHSCPIDSSGCVIRRAFCGTLCLSEFWAPRE